MDHSKNKNQHTTAKVFVVSLFVTLPISAVSWYFIIWSKLSQIDDGQDIKYYGIIQIEDGQDLKYYAIIVSLAACLLLNILIASLAREVVMLIRSKRDL